MEEPTPFLRMEIHWTNRGSRCFKTENLVLKEINENGTHKAKSVGSSLREHADVVKKTSKLDEKTCTMYRSIVRRLIYLAKITRPVLSVAASTSGSQVSSPDKHQMYQAHHAQP